MSLITPVLGSHHQIRQSIRSRQITDANDRISSGNRINNSRAVDSGSLRISERLKIENKFSHAAKRNLENAYNLAQYQADILNYADGTMRRMNDLAYQATDIMTSQSDREVLDAEFKSHSNN